MFILTISCLTMSNLPWFMDLTFQVPMQCCSLQHQILLSSPDTSTTEHCILFGPVASFILGLLVILHSSPVAYWTPSDPGDSSFAVISFWPFLLFMRFSQQVYWGGSCTVLEQLWGQKRRPSKMVGGVKSCLESNPIPTRDAQRNLVCTRTQRPRRD